MSFKNFSKKLTFGAAGAAMLFGFAACLTNPGNTSYYEQRGWSSSWWESVAPGLDEDSTVILPPGFYYPYMDPTDPAYMPAPYR